MVSANRQREELSVECESKELVCQNLAVFFVAFSHPLCIDDDVVVVAADVDVDVVAVVSVAVAVAVAVDVCCCSDFSSFVC